MRQITRFKGKHLGTHYIFDGYSEAVEYLSGKLAHLNVLKQDLSKLDCFPHWMMADVREGEWITTDNGIVIQVLRVHRMKEDRKPYEIVGIKTVGLYAYYLNYVRGEKAGYRISRGNMNVTEETISDNRARQTMGSSFNRYGTKKIWKRLFVYYLVVYLSPVTAFKLMLQKRASTLNINLGYRYYQREAFELLKDPFVVRELESYMKVDTYRDRLAAAMAKQGLGEERMITEIILGLDNVKKGTPQHKQFIELVLNLGRYAIEKEDIDASGRAVASVERAEPASFAELPPPPKGIGSLVNEETKLLVKNTKEKEEENENTAHTEQPGRSEEDERRIAPEDGQQCSASDRQNSVDIGVGSSSLPEVV